MIERRSLAALFLALPTATLAQGADPLPSWRDGPRKRALLDFVAAVTREGSADYVRPSARIAVFDNDG
ncbi:MAG: haloacid dehalogenase-like hydrolase, partial [Acetobacteraceae bacterium]